MPSIQDRLKKQPPFDQEEEKVAPDVNKTEEIIDESQEELIEKEEIEEPKEEPKAQAEEEIKEEPKEEQKEETKERTKQQFEKLKETNKRLKEEVEKYQDVLTSLQPQPPSEEPNRFTPYFEPILTNQPPTPSEYPGLTQEQIDETFQNLVDSEGYVNIDLLKQELLERQKREQFLAEKVKELEQKVEGTKRTFDDYQRTEQMKKIHQKYPQIDPDSPQFDERMWEAVRNEIIGQWTTQGKEDVEAACEKWLNILYPNMAKDKQAQQKAQINAVSPQPKSTVGEWEEHEELVRATQKGKKGAIAERLKRAGY